MSLDSQVTTSAPCRHVAPRALVYHRFCDGALTDNPTRSPAAPGRSRPEDAALLVADRLFAVVGGGLSLAFAMTAAAQLPVVGDAVLPGAHPVAAAVAQPRGGRAAQHRRPLPRAPARAQPARARSSTIRSSIRSPSEHDPELEIDKLRLAVRFEARGANAFRIAYTDSDPERAKRGHREADQAAAGQGRGAAQRAGADDRRRSRPSRRRRPRPSSRSASSALTEFLAKHPEFAQDPNAGRARARRSARSEPAKAVRAGNSRDVRARAPAPAHPGAARRAARRAAGAQSPPPPTPERIAAEQPVARRPARGRARRSASSRTRWRSTPTSTRR